MRGQSGDQRAGVISYRLHSSALCVDLRLLEANGRWVASADTTDGPSLGCGAGPLEAVWQALEPFEDVMDELLASQNW